MITFSLCSPFHYLCHCNRHRKRCWLRSLLQMEISSSLPLMWSLFPGHRTVSPFVSKWWVAVVCPHVTEFWECSRWHSSCDKGGSLRSAGREAASLEKLWDCVTAESSRPWHSSPVCFCYSNSGLNWGRCSPGGVSSQTTFWRVVPWHEVLPTAPEISYRKSTPVKALECGGATLEVLRFLNREGCVGAWPCRGFPLWGRELLFCQSTQLFFGPEEPFSTHSKAFSGELCCLIAHCFQNCFLLFVSNLPLLVSSHFNSIMEKNT